MGSTMQNVEYTATDIGEMVAIGFYRDMILEETFILQSLGLTYNIIAKYFVILDKLLLLLIAFFMIS